MIQLALVAVEEVDIGGVVDRYEGFREFVVGRSAALSRTAYLLTSDFHLAEDLLQTVLAKTALHWPRIRDGDPDAYVRRALYNEQVSRWRRRRVRETLAAQPPQRSSVDPTASAALRMTVLQALAQLPPRQRAVIVLRFYEDLTEVQVAAALEITVGTVKRAKHDALRRLRAIAPHLMEDTLRLSDQEVAK